MSYLDKSALKVVGTRPIRPDGVDKVTGRANFGADMVMPGMLWGRIKRSPHAHARDRYRKGGGVPRREGGHHPRRFSRYYAGACPYRYRPAQSARPVAQL